MGRKKIYPYNRWDNCCYCGKFGLNVIETHDDARRPHYCNKNCSSLRHSAVRKGLLPPITSETVRAIRKKKYYKDKNEGKTKPPPKVKDDEPGRKSIHSIKGPTSFEDQLWKK
jgi:hypothetical protein